MLKKILLLALAASAVTFVVSAQTICDALHEQDGSWVIASGYVQELDVGYNSYANFKIYDGLCTIHVYWNFPGTPPSWLKNDAYVVVEGTFWKAHEKHWWEPEIEAGSAKPAEYFSTNAPDIQDPDPWTITFWGAAGEVGGSCYQVTTSDASFLVDCGSFMNSDDMPVSERGSVDDCDPFPFDAAGISSLVVTHAHDDHVGRIHYLVARGFAGDIHMTAATAMIYREKLQDTLHYSCMPETQATAMEEKISQLIVEHDYGEVFEPCEGVSATFIDAGHIPGSASVSVEFAMPDSIQNIVLSGDIGSGHHPFLNPPDLDTLSTTGAKTLIIESTYGASDARVYPEDLYAEFFATVQGCLDNGKLVVIPAFALDRTQRVLAALLKGVREGRLDLDRPIGIGGKSSYYLTELYREMWSDPSLGTEYFSQAFLSMDPFAGDWEYVRSAPDNSDRETPWSAFKYDVVVTPSGTGSSSYALELINHYTGDSRVAFIQVGWSPSWTPLGELADSEQLYNVHDVFSGHADIVQLVEYVAALSDLERVVITHGDDGIGAREALADELRDAFPGIEIVLPAFGDSLPICDQL